MELNEEAFGEDLKRNDINFNIYVKHIKYHFVLSISLAYFHLLLFWLWLLSFRRAGSSTEPLVDFHFLFSLADLQLTSLQALSCQERGQNYKQQHLPQGPLGAPAAARLNVC